MVSGGAMAEGLRCKSHIETWPHTSELREESSTPIGLMCCIFYVAQHVHVNQEHGKHDDIQGT